MSFDVLMANGQRANRRITCEPARLEKARKYIRSHYGEIETQVVKWSTLLHSIYYYVPETTRG